MQQASKYPQVASNNLREKTTRNSRPTLRTIAEISGLAVATVSRALRDGDDISDKTKLRVRDIAKKIGYRPDKAGVGLRTGQTFVIAVIIDQSAEISDFERRIMMGISSVMRNTNYQIALTPFFHDTDELAMFSGIVDSSSADGIIFTNTRPQDERVKLLLEHDLPFVTHGRTELMTPHAYYDFDNAMFTKLASERLISKQRKDLALISPSTELTFYGHALSGFMNTASAAGVNAKIFEQQAANDSFAPALQAAACEAAQNGNLPDGIICSNEVSTLAFIDGAQEGGMYVGKDFDIISRQTSNILNYTSPRIDSIEEDLVTAGENMAELLLRRINGESPEKLQIIGDPIPVWRT